MPGRCPGKARPVARTFSPPDGWVVDLRAWRAGWAVRRAYAAALPALARRPVAVAGELPAEVVAFSGTRDLPEQVAAVRGLLARAGRPERLTVVSDGTHTGRARALLESLDPSVEVVHWATYAGELPPAVAAYAAGSPLGKKLAVELALPVRRPTVYLDSDVLLLDDGADLAGALDRPAYLLDEEDVYLDRRLLDGEAEAGLPCNAGVLVLTDRPDWGPALDRLARLHASGAEPVFHTEQTVVHLALRASGAVPLVPARYVCATDDMRVLRDAHPGPGVVLRDYTSPVRHRFWIAVARSARRTGAVSRA